MGVDGAGKTKGVGDAVKSPQTLISLLHDFTLPDVDYPDRYGNVGGLLDGHLRIGDTILPVPPQGITISEQNDVATIPLLRQSTATTLMNGKVDKTVVITMYFNSSHDICGAEGYVPTSHRLLYNADNDNPFVNNLSAPHPNTLRALVAQFKRTPIIPVENKDLFVNGIEALALMQLDIETVPNFPGLLKVSLVAIPYDAHNCLVGNLPFTSWIVWPIWRWHWRNEYLEINPDKTMTYAPPIINATELSCPLSFSIANERELTQRKAIYENESHITPEMYPLIEGDLTLDDRYIDNTVITEVRISFSNKFSILKATGKEEPFVQFMGGSNAEITISATCTSVPGCSTPIGVVQINSMYEDVRKIVRDHHFGLMSGFFKINNPLLDMFNIKYVVPTTKSVSTVPQFPTIRSVEMSFMTFDDKQKTREELENISHLLNTRYGEAMKSDMANKAMLLSARASSIACSFMPDVAYQAGAYAINEGNSSSNFLSSHTLVILNLGIIPS